MRDEVSQWDGRDTRIGGHTCWPFLVHYIHYWHGRYGRRASEGAYSVTGETERRRGFTTRAIHGTHYHGLGKGQPIAFPIFQTASFHFASAEEQEAVSSGAEPGF